jgi:hypothetical protein
VQFRKGRRNRSQDPARRRCTVDFIKLFTRSLDRIDLARGSLKECRVGFQSRQFDAGRSSAKGRFDKEDRISDAGGAIVNLKVALKSLTSSITRCPAC